MFCLVFGISNNSAVMEILTVDKPLSPYDLDSKTLLLARHERGGTSLAAWFLLL